MQEFLSLGITQSFTEPLKQSGVVTPTPIQQQAIPSILEGKDIIAQAQTGTGKTLAFVLPILENITPNTEHVEALIITPTRELAIQITAEIKKLIINIEGIDVLAVYGGQDVDKQLKKLKKNVQIVVGTPGRLGDHIRRETINLLNLKHLVLDEADQMLHIGFLHEVEDIIRVTPRNRQTMLFSATMPQEVRKLAQKHMDEPKYIQIEKTQGPATNVEQLAVHTTDRAKQGTLIQLIENYNPFLAVIFCRTKRRVSKLYGVLKSNGFQCDELHGDLSQAKREQVMKRFRDAKVQLLVATDVAARGLDVEGVTHVFNYDIPEDAESFVHRIGRTGRAGMDGMAITFYTTEDRPQLDMIEKELNISIQKQNLGNTIKKEELENDLKIEVNHTNKKDTKHTGNTSKRNRKPGNRSKQNGSWNSKGDSKNRRGSAPKKDYRGKSDEKRSSRNSSESRPQKNTKRSSTQTRTNTTKSRGYSGKSGR